MFARGHHNEGVFQFGLASRRLLEPNLVEALAADAAAEVSVELVTPLVPKWGRSHGCFDGRAKHHDLKGGRTSILGSALKSMALLWRDNLRISQHPEVTQEVGAEGATSAKPRPFAGGAPAASRIASDAHRPGAVIVPRF